MLNEIFQDRPGDARFHKCPSGVVSGDPVLIGDLPAVAGDNYDSVKGGTWFRFAGTYELTVIAATVVSPITGSAVKQGDTIYVTGSLDSTTNVTTSLVLSKATGGTKFGTYDSPTDITSGTTDTAARVKLRENAA